MSATFNSLTEDLVYEVLLASVHDVIAYWDYEESPSHQAPWNYAAINKLWRRVCLSTPRIWAFFRFQHYSDHSNRVDGVCTSGQSSIVRCQLQLKRSASLPISVYYHEIDVELSSCTTALAMLRLLGKHCKRWGPTKWNWTVFPEEQFLAVMPRNIR